MLKDAEGYLGAQRDTKRCESFPIDSKGLCWILRDTKGFQRILRNTRGYSGILRDAKGC